MKHYLLAVVDTVSIPSPRASANTVIIATSLQSFRHWLAGKRYACLSQQDPGLELMLKEQLDFFLPIFVPWLWYFIATVHSSTSAEWRSWTPTTFGWSTASATSTGAGEERTTTYSYVSCKQRTRIRKEDHAFLLAQEFIHLHRSPGIVNRDKATTLRKNKITIVLICK